MRIWRELFYASTRLQINPELDIVPKRGIENIKVYTGGKSTVKGKSKIIKLSSNENALKPSPNVYKIVQNENSLHRYGEINGQSLRKQISEIHSIEENQIIIGNGSNEILLMSVLAFCHPGDEIIHSRKIISQLYLDKLYSIPTIKIRKFTDWNYSYFPIILQSEKVLNKVQNVLNKENIFPRRYFYPSLDTLPYINNSYCNVSQDISSRILCLPIYKSLSLKKVELISKLINNNI